MKRAVIIVMDSVGIGSLEDAAFYGDAGADTLGHIASYCVRVRGRPLAVPALAALGIGEAARLSQGERPSGLELPQQLIGRYGAAAEQSHGKIRPRVTGRSLACRFSSTGVISRKQFLLFQISSSKPCAAGRASLAFLVIAMRLAPRLSKLSGPSTSAQASRSATPPPTASFKSRRTRKASALPASTAHARPRASSATNIRSGGSSHARLPERRAPSRAPRGGVITPPRHLGRRSFRSRRRTAGMSFRLARPPTFSPIAGRAAS